MSLTAPEEHNNAKRILKQHLCFVKRLWGEKGLLEAKLFHPEGTEVLMNLWPFFVNMHSDFSCELKCNTYNKHQDCQKKDQEMLCFSSFSSLLI